MMSKFSIAFSTIVLVTLVLAVYYTREANHPGTTMATNENEKDIIELTPAVLENNEIEIDSVSDTDSIDDYILNAISELEADSLTGDDSLATVANELQNARNDLIAAKQVNSAAELTLTQVSPQDETKPIEVETRDTEKSYDELLARLVKQTGLSSEELDKLFTKDFKRKPKQTDENTQR